MAGSRARSIEGRGVMGGGACTWAGGRREGVEAPEAFSGKRILRVVAEGGGAGACGSGGRWGVGERRGARAAWAGGVAPREGVGPRGRFGVRPRL